MVPGSGMAASLAPAGQRGHWREGLFQGPVRLLEEWQSAHETSGVAGERVRGLAGHREDFAGGPLQDFEQKV